MRLEGRARRWPRRASAWCPRPPEKFATTRTEPDAYRSSSSITNNSNRSSRRRRRSSRRRSRSSRAAAAVVANAVVASRRRARERDGRSARASGDIEELHSSLSTTRVLACARHPARVLAVSLVPPNLCGSGGGNHLPPGQAGPARERVAQLQRLRPHASQASHHVHLGWVWEEGGEEYIIGWKMGSCRWWWWW